MSAVITYWYDFLTVYVAQILCLHYCMLVSNETKLAVGYLGLGSFAIILFLSIFVVV